VGRCCGSDVRCGELLRCSDENWRWETVAAVEIGGEGCCN